LKRLITASVVSLVFVVPATANAKPVSRQHSRQYERLYKQVAQKFGKRTPGRNIVKDGTRKGAATDAQVVASIAEFVKWLTPPPVVAPAPVYSAPAGTYSAPVSTSYSGGYSIPSSIVQCESGGNWSAVNSSSGAGGAYQILPSTWAAYGGTGSPQDASPAEQSAIASRIWASQGASAWVC
jgi:hypothetical protein